jgi:hypothetical protein
VKYVALLAISSFPFVAFFSVTSKPQYANFAAQPVAYSSFGGRYRLLVDPGDFQYTQMYYYRLTREGRMVWSGERKLSLDNASVSDKGIVLGTQVAAIIDIAGQRQKGEQLQVAAMDAKGNVTIVDSRDYARDPHGYMPTVTDILLDDASAIGIVVINTMLDDKEISAWRLVDLHTLSLINTVYPAWSGGTPASLSREVKALLLPETRFALVRWACTFSDNRSATRFGLVDRQGRFLWGTEFEDDAKSRAHSWRELREQKLMWLNKELGSFSVSSNDGLQIQSYQVKLTASGDFQGIDLVSDR